MSNLTKEEMKFIYWQLLARKEFFEEEMIIAASEKDLKRITDCNDALTTIRAIQNKLIN